MPVPPFIQSTACGLAVISLTLVLALPSPAVSKERSPTAIADAVQHKNFSLASQLINEGVDVNATQADGMSALHWASLHDDSAAVVKLISAGAKVSKATRFGITPLTIACQNGSQPIVELLLSQGADPNTKRDGDESALATASRTGNVGAVNALIKSGADIDSKDHRGQTPLMWAAAEGNTDVVNALLEHNVNQAEMLDSGFTALTFAIRQGHINVVKALLTEDVDITATMSTKGAAKGKANSGMSPLMLAIENAHFELALILLQAGADPNDDRTGFAPLHALSWVRKPEIGDNQRGNPPPRGSGNLSSLNFAAALVTHGADINLPKRNNGGGRLRISVKGATPFLCAASTADLPYMKALLALGADPTATTAKRQNALMMAAGIDEGPNADGPATADEHYAAVTYILDLNINDIDAVDHIGQNVMHAAAYKSLPEVVRLFDRKGANIELWNQENKQGRTPLAIARGFRPGNFKPDQDTEQAIIQIMREHAVEVPLSNQNIDQGWKDK